MSHIYILTNKINNKKYIGQTIDIERRIAQHKNANGKQLIHKAIKKYGWDNFSVLQRHKKYLWRVSLGIL